LNIPGSPVVVLGDLHAPYVDRAAFSIACQIIEAVRPGAVVLNGDILDCYQVSRYSQDPKRKTEFQKDLDSCKECLQAIHRAAFDHLSWIYYIEGNHERRLTDWKWKNPEAASLEALTIPSLLGLEELGIRWVPEKERLMLGDWLITHGTVCRQKAGYTAQAMIDRFGCSGVSNHVHRLAQVSRSVWKQSRTWIENGCLCSLDMEYLDLCDWQHGFTVLRAENGGEVWPELVTIRNGKARYHGVTYTAC
jgi:hypothetical protein